MAHSLLNLFSIGKSPQDIESTFIESVESVIRPDPDPNTFVVSDFPGIHYHDSLISDNTYILIACDFEVLQPGIVAGLFLDQVAAEDIVKFLENLFFANFTC
jgi:hypothetical protein